MTVDLDALISRMRDAAESPYTQPEHSDVIDAGIRALESTVAERDEITESYKREVVKAVRAEVELRQERERADDLNRVRAEAREAAYRHAAEVAHAEARWQWERDRGHVPGAQIVAQRMQVIEACLTGFADRIEQNSEVPNV